MPKTFEIYFHNLTPGTKRLPRIPSPGELNCEYLPIAIIEKESDND
jgi:hypothetical protein